MTDKATQQRFPFREKIQVKLIGQDAFFGPGPRQLLLGIRERGSVSGACQAIGISYSKGRGIIRRMERELGFELVQRRQGGTGGGSAGLTPTGRCSLRYSPDMRTPCGITPKTYSMTILTSWRKDNEAYKDS